MARNTTSAATSALAAPPQRTYYVYACAESEDTVHKLRFGPSGFEELSRISVGSFPADIEGPHGIGVSPDGKAWFVSIAHGLPFGSIHKYDTSNDEWLGDATVGMFAATLSISPSTGLLYVVNFDLHGDMVPSTMSVVETSTMIEVARIPTGIMPHGVRLDRKGARAYSANMMNDSIVEVDLDLAGAGEGAAEDPDAFGLGVDPEGSAGGRDVRREAVVVLDVAERGGEARLLRGLRHALPRRRPFLRPLRHGPPGGSSASAANRPGRAPARGTSSRATSLRSRTAAA